MKSMKIYYMKILNTNKTTKFICGDYNVKL